jgi:two-component system, OmpR family, sensor histidine kinase SenX3
MTPGRRRSVVVFIALGVCLASGAIALNVGWIIVSWQNVGLMVVGLLVFPLVITGVVLNTIFLVREVRRNEQHEAFINAVTHELKTPVASMRLHLQTLQNREVDEATRQGFYSVMLEDSDRLQGTIEQVLRAGEVRTKRRASSQMAVNLHTVVSDCIDLARTRHRLSGETLTYQPPSNSVGPGLVLGDEDELKVVVSNLVDNAIKYSGSNVRVAVELEHTGPTAITLRVRDQGIGIEPSQRKRIFKRFYRIPGTNRVEGTGLGLFIVRSVVVRHGGQVYAESDGQGQGSTFVVRLPLVAAR